MTQATLAAKGGMTQQHIAKTEKGITRPRPGTLAKIERVLDASKPYEYPAGEPPRPAFRITDQATTWFTRETERETFSR